MTNQELRGPGSPELERLTPEPDSDLRQRIENLSPSTKEGLQILLKFIEQGEATIDVNAEGRPFVAYKTPKKVVWDGSKANIIAEPKSEQDLKVKVDACLELVGYLKSEKPPSGVVLDKTKIKISPGKQYRQGHEFEKTKKVLGSGNAAGNITVVEDTTTGLEHACKSMLISVFREDEIRCWVDLSDSGFVPSLYLFTIEGNRVVTHMEILRNAQTLRNIIDKQMNRFHSVRLIKSFSLFVLDGLLNAVAEMVARGWTHNDLHGGNVMLQKGHNDSLKVKILDFGLASPFTSSEGLNYRGFESDIWEVLRLFSGLYTTLEFVNKEDIKCHYLKEIPKIAEVLKMTTANKKELFYLVDTAMNIVHPTDLEWYRGQVKQSLDRAMKDAGGQDVVMKQVAAILFPDSYNQDELRRDVTDEEELGVILRR